MKVSLRRALQLRSDLARLLDHVRITPAPISIYETDVSAAIATRRVDILSALAQAERAEMLLATLEKAINKQNAAAGIYDILTDQTRAQSRRYRLEELIAAKPAQLEHIRGRFDAARECLPDSDFGDLARSGADEFETEVLSDDDLATLKREQIAVQRQLRDLSDALNDANNRNTVDLAQADVAWLQEQGLA